MLRITVRTLLDRVLDLPWLVVVRLRQAAAAVRRRSPDALDVLGRPVVVGGLARKLAFGVRSTALAAADVLGGLPAFVRQRGFRPLAPRAIALVATPIATAALVLVVAAQTPSLVRGANQQAVLAGSMGVEEPAAAAVVARVERAAPARKAALPRARAARSLETVSRSTTAKAPSATVERRAVRQATSPAASVRPRAAVAPRSSTRRASPLKPKAAPRVSARPPRPDARPRQPKRSGGGDETPKAEDPPAPTPAPTGGGGDETPKDDDRGDDDDRDRDGDDDRGDRDRDDDDDDRGDRDRDRDDDDDRRDRDRDKGEEDHDLDDRDDEDDDD
jgi:hypothetical protein